MIDYYTQRKLRVPLASLVAFLCIVLLWFSLPPAPVGAQTEIWSASLTAGGDADLAGYCKDDPDNAGTCIGADSTSSIGSMNPLTFSFDGVSYEVLVLMNNIAGGSGNPPGLHLTVDPGLPSSIVSQAELIVSGFRWSFHSASPTPHISQDYVIYYWSDSSTIITSGSSYSVSIELPPAPDPDNVALSIASSGGSGGGGGSKSKPKFVPKIAPPRTCEELPAGLRVTGTGGLEQCTVLDAMGVGNAEIVAAGFLSAVDVWSYLAAGVTVCFDQAGAVVLLDASTAPRTLYALNSQTSAGETCAFTDRAGTLVLLPADSALLSTLPTMSMSGPVVADQATAEEAGLSGCMVSPTVNLNLRVEPAGAIIGGVGGGWRLTAIRRDPDWFEVDVRGVTGWISADYVTPYGGCA